jgi:transposase
MKQQKQPCRKKPYEKVTFQHKLFVVDQITNGQISANFASKKYNISRSTIAYWLKKYSTLDQQNTGMSKQDEIKVLKERIEELEFVKDFQQDIITDMELITGVDMSKKSLPKTLAKEIALKKKNRLKENGSTGVLGLVNKPSTKDVKHNKNNK